MKTSAWILFSGSLGVFLYILFQVINPPEKEIKAERIILDGCTYVRSENTTYHSKDCGGCFMIAVDSINVARGFYKGDSVECSDCYYDKKGITKNYFMGKPQYSCNQCFIIKEKAKSKGLIK